MTPVVLALTSAALFGAMTVAIRAGLRGGPVEAAALATILPALAVVAVAAAARGGGWRDTWPFLLAGVLAPGMSQILFTRSIREAGASRTSVAVGTAPLAAVALALVFLDEPLRLPLALGALLVVGGGILLAREPGRPADLRAIGLLFAAGASILFAVRDVLVRGLHGHADPESAAAATLLAGMLVALVATRRLPTRGEARRFAPAGILFGLSYLCLFEAYFHGGVSIVSPLVATESLWGVGLAALAFGRAEGVGSRVLGGAVLVVLGGALIGAFR